MRRFASFVFAAAVCAAATAPYSTGAQEISSEDAQIAFNNHCRQCHSTDAGDNRLGPNLNQIIGRKAAAAEGYAYSDALAGADVTWDAETLDAFIADPESVVPGNNMKPYPGVADADIRARIVAHLGG